MPDDVTVAQRGQERLRVLKSHYKDRDRLDLRVWFVNQDGELRPTRKGINLPVERGEDLVAAIREVCGVNGG